MLHIGVASFLSSEGPGKESDSYLIKRSQLCISLDAYGPIILNIASGSTPTGPDVNPVGQFPT
ncbi:MAG: hypothetical protein M3Z35_06415, partial [Nitrospirota bacterium]|nr:hypothetical protein [Nitrospirota bacterium]